MSDTQTLINILQSTRNILLDGHAINRASGTIEHFEKELMRTNPGKASESTTGYGTFH